MQYNRHKIKLLISISLLISLSSSANTNYFEDSKRGWFWGEKKEIEEKEKKEQQIVNLPNMNNIKNSQFNNDNLNKLQEELKKKDEMIITYGDKQYKSIPTTTDVPWPILDKLHPDEIVALETQTKNIAVMYPSNENILEYKKLQHFISNKALGFTDSNYLITKKDPEISNWASSTSMKSRIEITTKRETETKEQISVIQKHKDKMIILVATLPTCPYCEKQIPLLQKFKNDYDVEYKEIDISKNKEFGIKYQVQKTPDLFLLYKNNNGEPQMTRFGNGLHTIQDLRSGVLAGLYTFEKIPKELLDY